MPLLPPPAIEFSIAGHDLIGLALQQGVSFTVNGIRVSYNETSFSIEKDIGKGVAVGAGYSDVAQTMTEPVGDSRFTGRLTIRF